MFGVDVPDHMDGKPLASRAAGQSAAKKELAKETGGS